MVRLITHNMLTCHVKNCTKDNFPLAFSDVELVIRPAPENLEFIQRFLPKLEWSALVDTARSLGDTALPDEQPAEMNEEQLKALHHVLMEVCLMSFVRTGNELIVYKMHVEEGKMTCRGCGHVYPIANGIPNMLLAEHEVGR